ncbi:MAG: UpxZ family transcription anti-terminator antagonist [Muribaculaceae bacterium]
MQQSHHMLKSQIDTLYAKAHRLLYALDEDTCYADTLGTLRQQVTILVNTLIKQHSTNPEEEATLCLALLLGLIAINDNERKDAIITRTIKILPQLPPTTLKVQLLTYLHIETTDPAYAHQARLIATTCKDIPKSIQNDIMQVIG